MLKPAAADQLFPAVDFQLPDPDGNLHRLSDYHGRWLLQVFHRHLG